MNDSNQQTIQAYEDHVQDYINGTVQDMGDGTVKDWIDEFLTDLPKTARILELGSAFGRDATYVQSIGYTVECTDATQAFVDLLNQKGFNARKLNAITDDLGGPYDLVFANAVLVHFTRDETKQVLRKVFDALSEHGTFAFTVKQGAGEKWTDAAEDKLGVSRYFCYWTEDQIRQVVQGTGFSEVKASGDQPTSRATWVQVIARK
ncbi:MAG TPA: class I SAM-dependent methyltransferase [Candidatus Saccharimonadales bacterium]|jgi:predicted TPR repeat methyltransferase|nr:class I SAM-dependent methyltransferase [Candidatus Saccharimonadales bacterium]